MKSEKWKVQTRFISKLVLTLIFLIKRTNRVLYFFILSMQSVPMKSLALAYSILNTTPTLSRILLFIIQAYSLFANLVKISNPTPVFLEPFHWPPFFSAQKKN